MYAEPAPRTYRWVTEGNTYRYQPAVHRGNDLRRGTPCQAVTVPRPGRGPGNVLVKFSDGHTAVVPAGTLRKV